MPLQINIKRVFLLIFLLNLCGYSFAQFSTLKPQSIKGKQTTNSQQVAPKSNVSAPQKQQKTQPKTSQKSVAEPQKDSKKTMVYLEHCQSLSFDQERLPDVQLLKGDVCFRHDDAFLYCDSAYFFEHNNSFNAYGHVKIVQGDTLFVFGDVLYYNGNTKMARLRHNVKMQNQQVTLTTDSLNYDRQNEVGYYFLGGKLQDDQNTLTSVFGYYYPNTDNAIFNDSVVLTNPKFVLKSDTLQYNTKTEIADILGATTIVYEGETTIFSTRGWYDTRTEKSQLLDKSHIYHQDGKHLTGDTIFYDKKVGRGEVFKNVTVEDTTNHMMLCGHYSRYIEEGDIALATDSALMKEFSDVDTLYMHADTLYSYAVDSTKNEVLAYHNVRMYRNDFQGVCDSAIYHTADSTLWLLRMPLLWSENRQLSGDTIRALMSNGELDKVIVTQPAFVCEKEDSVKFNQLSGKELIAYIRQEELKQIDINGNAQSIFYPKEEDGTLIGLNQTESSFLSAFFEEGKLSRLVLKPKPSGIMYPLDQIPTESLYLRYFSWQEEFRPTDWHDVFSERSRERYKQTAVNKDKKNEKKSDGRSRRQEEQKTMTKNFSQSKGK